MYDKEVLLQQFAAYLDDRDEIAEEEVDLAALFQELAELKNEVKGESRQLKRALDYFKHLVDRLQQEEGVRQEHCLVAQPFFLELLTFHDYLRDATRSVEAFVPQGLWISQKTRAHAEALRKGHQMLFKRWGALLRAHEVVPIDMVGQPLDPYIARAVEMGEDPFQPSGVVLTERVQGFRWKGELLRVAEVVVNKTREVIDERDT